MEDTGLHGGAQRRRPDSGELGPHRTPGAKVRVVVFVSSSEKPLEVVVPWRDRSLFAFLKLRSRRSGEGRLLGLGMHWRRKRRGLFQETQRR